jgi:hypothetical protein
VSDYRDKDLPMKVDAAASPDRFRPPKRQASAFQRCYRSDRQRKPWLFGVKRRTAFRRTPRTQGSHMQILSARHVKTEESLRLGVVSGWYSTKVSGTFVTGPHTTQEDCLSKIAELNPAPARKKF